MRHRSSLFAVLSLGLLWEVLTPVARVRADEGMWLLNDPPRQLLKKKYDFDLTDAWLEHAQKASVRFNNGGSGGFVSPDGLIVTNHHIGADQLQKLSGKGKDYLRDGFFARATSSTPTYRPVTSPFTGWVSSKRCASSTMPGRWSAS